MRKYLLPIGILLILSLNAHAEVDWVKAEKEIKRLRPDAFTRVPADIKKKIDDLGCTIPQPSTPQPFPEKPQNLISGHFANNGSRDWAFLCSKNGSSSVRIIWENGQPCPSSFKESADKDYLQGSGPNTAWFSRGISTATPKSIKAYQKSFGGPLPKNMNHEGIEDSFLEKASTIFYCENGEWLELQGAD